MLSLFVTPCGRPVQHLQLVFERQQQLYVGVRQYTACCPDERAFAAQEGSCLGGLKRPVGVVLVDLTPQSSTCYSSALLHFLLAVCHRMPGCRQGLSHKPVLALATTCTVLHTELFLAKAACGLVPAV
jgi:hypothetical protein